MLADVLKQLEQAGMLVKSLPEMGYVSTGSYALNRVISGSYFKGIPLGRITQFRGEASTAKTVFVTQILKEAQDKGFYTVLIDSENSFDAFGLPKAIGLDMNKLIEPPPEERESIEDCFSTMEKLIHEIRKLDNKTPIVIGYDSIAVSPSKKELEIDDYDADNMSGAQRAKVAGFCLKRINGLLRKNNVALVIVNQLRSKVGVIYGNPETNAAGGKALDFYLAVDMKTVSNKSTDILKDAIGKPIGIKGKLINRKNKISLPFQECKFELLFDKGLTLEYGLLDFLVQDGILEKNGGWYSVVGGDTKFQESKFLDNLNDLSCKGLDKVRNLLGLKLIN